MSDSLRKAAAAGQFYPASCSEITAEINTFTQAFKQINIAPEIEQIVPKAVIVPHAGYIYSGFTANIAYHFLSKSQPKRIIVIGPSHRHYFKGISGAYYEAFETPCGSLTIDSAYLFALAKKFNISFEPKAHSSEHSTEVQMPFIKHYFKKSEVIELVYGEMDPAVLANIIIALLKNPDNRIVISTDLSHFHSLKQAKQLDYHCLKVVEELNTDLLQKGCEACGHIGIEAMILAAKAQKLSSKLLDYRTSADRSGDESSVVGYMSAMFY